MKGLRLQYRSRVVMLLCLLLVLCGLTYWCTAHKPIATSAPDRVGSTFVKAVWVNYVEYAGMIHGKTETQFQTTVKNFLQKLKETGINTVFLHLRSHSDSLYPSQLFPWSVHVNGGAGVPYDPTAYFVDAAHQMGIAVHAWVNPYRVSGKGLQELSAENPAHAGCRHFSKSRHDLPQKGNQGAHGRHGQADFAKRRCFDRGI